MKDSCRINLDIPIKTKESIESLKERSGATTLTEVVKRSLALYDMILACSQSGGKIIIQSPDGEKETLKLL